jgi:hypothetical protein
MHIFYQICSNKKRVSGDKKLLKCCIFKALRPAGSDKNHIITVLSEGLLAALSQDQSSASQAAAM